MWINILIDVLLVVYVADCLFMGLVILMQRSKQEGLGAAFGGGFTDSIWGAQTSQVLVRATAYAAALFFILSISLARLYAMRESSGPEISPVQLELEKTVAPAATNAAPVTTPAPSVVAPAATSATPATNPTAAPTPAPVKIPTH